MSYQHKTVRTIEVGKLIARNRRIKPDEKVAVVFTPVYILRKQTTGEEIRYHGINC